MYTLKWKSTLLAYSQVTGIIEQEHHQTPVTNQQQEEETQTHSGGALSKQVSIILWIHEKYITYKYQETAQKIFAKFIFDFKYVNEEEFLDLKQEYYRLREEANNGTTCIQEGAFQIYKRLPNRKHPAEDYRAAIQLLGRPISYKDFFNKLEQ
ncbi:8590_t:CDS:2, partial [Racocetra persica]